jgi:predicted transcriptional regulator
MASSHHLTRTSQDHSRISAGEKDREEGDHAEHKERQPGEHERDEVRDDKGPFDEP